ncbi:serine/threonine protein kinase [Trichodesmium erythraeum IMS101]|uniref:Serine/threonine protein kinase n=1 Tax=Trichodesmium erythraeum (strain IMS101) TaxID=203124 RepID=Q10WN1_TRIEI
MTLKIETTQCLNPDCLEVNQAQTKFCTSCGEKLVLRERYRPLKIIGEGGFGRTFQAVDEDKPSKPFCVIKQFFPQAQGTKNLEKAAKLFAQEAERLDGLGRHSQIPELLAYFTQNNRQYLVQEFIDGQNLKQELEESGAFSENQILELLKSLLPVLEFIHSQQIIHRDIKPENIIRRRKDNQLVLVDCGAAKYATMTALGRTGTVIGSAGYVAPEQSVGKASFVSDIYSLGVTCIHLLTQIEPFDLFDVSENDWVWRDYLQSNVSNECGEILDKMIVGATKKRFQNVGEILSVIQPTSQRKTQHISPPQISQPQRAQPEKGKLFTFEVVRVNASGSIVNRRQESARQIIEDLGNGVSLEMVKIPGGRFLMGSPNTEAKRHSNEGPQHYVDVPEFWMGKYVVTQQQWQAIMGNDPSKFKGKNRPVECVSWNNATEFCQKLSKKTGRDYRLPSEAEWEYACRAGTTTPFYFGETITTELVNYDGKYTYGNEPKGKYREQTTPVGQFPANAFGLYDMHGNVWEWCADEWHNNYAGAPTDGSVWLNGNKERSPLRGGSWYDLPNYCRSAVRDTYSVRRDDHFFITGFRLVCDGGKTQHISPPQISQPQTSQPEKGKLFTFEVVRVNASGSIVNRRQESARQIIEDLGNGVSLEMVKIPGGRFLMGSPDTEAERLDKEGPQHYVDVPEFWMGKYVVTQQQWQAIMGNDPSEFKGKNRPVECVSWNNATEFCQKLSKKTGRDYRLPSEAEWEYACRAGTTTPFYFGETITTELVNYDGNYTYGNGPKGKYREQTTPVGQFPANAFGLYDMHGNVWEWCADEWHNNYAGAPTDGSVWLNGNKERSPLRGGSWLNLPINCRSAVRNYFYRRVDLNYDTGFRLVCDGGRTL